MRLFIAAVCMVGLAGLWGCGGDAFEPYNELAGLRLLAISADPPQLGYQETASLTPLVFSEGDLPVRYTWSWCPLTSGASDGYTCLISHAELSAIMAFLAPHAAPLPGYDLGSASTASFTNPFSPQLLGQLCAQFAAASGQLLTQDSCIQGFGVTVSLRVESAAGVIDGVKEISVLIDDAAAPNRNPVSSGVRVQRQPTDEVFTQLPDLDGLLRETTYTLLADVAQDQAESYVGEDRYGNRVTIRESLLLSWFVHGGETTSSRTSFLEGDRPLSEALRNAWETPSARDFSADVAELIVVVRDNRGGTSWRRYPSPLLP